MASIEFVTLEVADTAAAKSFYTSAHGLDTQVRLRAPEEPPSGFRGFTLALVVSQPGTVDNLVRAALDAGAAQVSPVAKALWGYGGVLRALDGTILTAASSSKKDVPSPRSRASLPQARVPPARHRRRFRLLHRSRRVHVGDGFRVKT